MRIDKTKNIYKPIFIFYIIILLTVSGLAVEPITDIKLKERADAILSLMAFTVLPDVTTSSLSITDPINDDTDFFQSTLGGGFTWSQQFPLYLEGTIGYSRYHPSFITSYEDETLIIPIKWNSFTLSGGIGWDFPLTEDKELKLRPIFNFALGHMKSDASFLADYLEENLGLDPDDLKFLHRGRMNAYGLGGSVMLDWEHYREDYEIDVEFRYSHMNFKSFHIDYSSVQGSSNADIVSLWTRWRAPSGMNMLKRPVRYVLEGSNTVFFGSQRDQLGFNYLTTLGVGFELDTSAYPVFITRTRLLYRYTFGENISGHSIGLAVSF